ncbi:MAG: hypothetical protein KUG81_03125 [Gammaproteobacteria bacterium]|nr:hypothetical protein [Gammaproteobacteria bacterium]
MKTLILFLITSITYAQAYTTFSFDVNKLTQIKDNKRTVVNHKGLDFDIEVGAIDENFGVYVFYGAFPNAYYSNYGVGVDYYIKAFKNVSFSIGNYYSKVMRHKKYSWLGGGVSFLNPRVKTSFDTSWITIELIAQLQSRPDIDKRIFEGKIGITKKFN